MKKLLAFVTIVGCLLSVPTKKAEAGVVIGMTGFALGSEYGESSASPYFASMPGAVIAGLGVWMIRATHGVWGTIGGTLLIALDADSSLNQQKLEQVLVKTYPFINNFETIKSLAMTVKTKMPLKMEKDKEYLVRLTEEETLIALESADLSDEEIAFVVNDLK